MSKIILDLTSKYDCIFKDKFILFEEPTTEELIVPFEEHTNILWHDNMCWFYSVIQLLYSMTLFRNHFMSLENPETPIECFLKKIFIELYNNRDKPNDFH